MTYFGILLTFVLPPLVLLAVFVPGADWRALFKRPRQINWAPYAALLVHVLIALTYTTPWDNYLVANRVWWYDPALVTGITLGWVPIEEYTFFILQTLLTGLWTLALLRLPQSDRAAALPAPAAARLRWIGALALALLWLASIVLLAGGWTPGAYLGLILVWAIPPVILQFAFGADILWRRRGVLALAVLIPTAYLWLVDAYAIRGGTWSIDPAQTTGLGLQVFPGSLLPVEEMLFFLATNIIVSFGITLMLARESRHRLPALKSLFAHPSHGRKDSPSSL